jgi:hypothetical protein
MEKPTQFFVKFAAPNYTIWTKILPSEKCSNRPILISLHKWIEQSMKLQQVNLLEQGKPKRNAGENTAKQVTLHKLVNHFTLECSLQ